MYDGDKLIANFEISKKGDLKQLLGRFNIPLHETAMYDILETMISKKIIRKSSIKAAWDTKSYNPLKMKELTK